MLSFLGGTGSQIDPEHILMGSYDPIQINYLSLNDDHGVKKMKHISTHTSKHVLCTQTILTWDSLSVVWPGGHVDNVAQFTATSQQNDSSRLFSPPAGVAMLKLLFHHNNC